MVENQNIRIGMISYNVEEEVTVEARPEGDRLRYYVYVGNVLVYEDNDEGEARAQAEAIVHQGGRNQSNMRILPEGVERL